MIQNETSSAPCDQRLFTQDNLLSHTTKHLLVHDVVVPHPLHPLRHVVQLLLGILAASVKHLPAVGANGFSWYVELEMNAWMDAWMNRSTAQSRLAPLAPDVPRRLGGPGPHLFACCLFLWRGKGLSATETRAIPAQHRATGWWFLNVLVACLRACWCTCAGAPSIRQSFGCPLCHCLLPLPFALVGFSYIGYRVKPPPCSLQWAEACSCSCD